MPPIFIFGVAHIKRRVIASPAQASIVAIVPGTCNEPPA
jgi:hypothetical protein